MYGIYLELLDINYPCCGLLERMTNVYAKKNINVYLLFYFTLPCLNSLFPLVCCMQSRPQAAAACTITHETLMFIILS